jgi:hypothetical protein
MINVLGAPAPDGANTSPQIRNSSEYGAISKHVSRPFAEIDGRVRTFLDRLIEGDWPYL